MRTFIPPKKNRFIYWVCSFFSDFILKKIDNISEVVFSSSDLALLKSLKEKRVLIFSNHPTHVEPKLMFYLGKLMESSFNIMASRIVFSWAYGLFGFIIRRTGGYSIIPAANDIVSFRYSVKILSQDSGKLVIFPEGAPVSQENTTLMPLQDGFSFLSMMSLDRIRKKNFNGDICVLPVFCFYVYDASVDDIKANINERIEWLEKYYGIKTNYNENNDIIEFILKLSLLILERYETIYNIEPKSNEKLQCRWERLRQCILDKLAVAYNIENYDEEESSISKLRRISGIIQLHNIKYEIETPLTFSKKEKKENKKDLENIINIIIFDDAQLIDNPSYERCLEFLDRFEKISKKKKAYPPLLPRKVHIKIGNSFYISEYYSKEKSKRKVLMEAIRNRIKKELQDLLTNMEHLSHKL